MADMLTQMGQPEAAKKFRDRATRIEKVADQPIHSPVDSLY